MVDKLRAYWTDLTTASRFLRMVGAAVVLVYGGVLGFDRVYQLPTQVDDLKARVMSLEEFKRFQGCWMLETAEGRDPNPCRYLLDNPEEFRPPFTTDAP